MNYFYIRPILQIWKRLLYLFADLKGMLEGERFQSKEEVFAETIAFFEGKKKSYYKKWLKRRWIECITLDGDGEFVFK